MTQRFHLFPFRTQKLSSVVPKILGWRRPGKIGRRRLFSSLYSFHSHRPVSMTRRFHLFPFRTQKLSSVVPKILGWRRPGKIGRRRLANANKAECRWAFLLLEFGFFILMARWSSGQDGGLSRRKREFDISHGSPRRNGLHSIQKAQPFGWAFLISFRHSFFSPQNFAKQTFVGLRCRGKRTPRQDELHFIQRAQLFCWAFSCLSGQAEQNE